MSTVTPSGIAIGFLPIRLIGPPITIRRRQPRRRRPCWRASCPVITPVEVLTIAVPMPPMHARDLLVGDVTAPARTRDPLQAADHRLAPVRVPELDPDHLADRGRLDREAADVALLLEDPGHLLLQPRGGDLDLGCCARDRVARRGSGNRRSGRSASVISSCVSTSSTWSFRGCSPCARARAGTAGRGRTSGSRRAGARTGGSGCSARLLYFGLRCCRTICEVLAMFTPRFAPGSARSRPRSVARSSPPRRPPRPPRPPLLGPHALRVRLGVLLLELLEGRRLGLGALARLLPAPLLLLGLVVDLARPALLREREAEARAAARRPPRRSARWW